MKRFFTPAFFKANRECLRKTFKGDGPIIITANGQLQRNSDVSYPFRQDSNFWYLTGIHSPDVILVMGKQTDYLVVAYRDANRSVFDGSIDKQTFVDQSGITAVCDETEGWDNLKKELTHVKQVGILAATPAYLASAGFYTNPARAHLAETLKTINPKTELLDIRQELANLRLIKQPEEIQAIQKAVAITVDTFKAVTQHVSFATEHELEGFITAQFRSSNAIHAYQPIVASGPHACTLHYVDNATKIAAGQLLLIDVGAEVENYAADITRTLVVQTATKRQQQILQTVADIQAYAKGLLKPGVKLREYAKDVQQFTGEKLRELGLIADLKPDHIRQYFPHSVSHFLGLDVHDVGNYDSPLKSGMVLTVEPGIYIPEEGIGVRIEDDVLITEKGNQNLSQQLPALLA